MSAITAVLMTITMFLPNGNELREEWSIVESTTLDHCIQMNEIFATGGPRAVMTVKCKRISLLQELPK